MQLSVHRLRCFGSNSCQLIWGQLLEHLLNAFANMWSSVSHDRLLRLNWQHLPTTTHAACFQTQTAFLYRNKKPFSCVIIDNAFLFLFYCFLLIYWFIWNRKIPCIVSTVALVLALAFDCVYELWLDRQTCDSRWEEGAFVWFGLCVRRHAVRVAQWL